MKRMYMKLREEIILDVHLDKIAVQGCYCVKIMIVLHVQILDGQDVVISKSMASFNLYIDI